MKNYHFFHKEKIRARLIYRYSETPPAQLSGDSNDKKRTLDERMRAREATDVTVRALDRLESSELRVDDEARNTFVQDIYNDLMAEQPSPILSDMLRISEQMQKIMNIIFTKAFEQGIRINLINSTLIDRENPSFQESINFIISSPDDFPTNSTLEVNDVDHIIIFNVDGVLVDGTRITNEKVVIACNRSMQIIGFAD